MALLQSVSDLIVMAQRETNLIIVHLAEIAVSIDWIASRTKRVTEV